MLTAEVENAELAKSSADPSNAQNSELQIRLRELCATSPQLYRIHIPGANIYFEALLDRALASGLLPLDDAIAKRKQIAKH